MKSKLKKGQYGYRNYHRTQQLFLVSFGAAMIIIQLLARCFTDNEAARNILTVMAILSVLPTANLASPLLASWRYKTPPREFYDALAPYESRGILLYDLIITSKEMIIPADAVMVHPMGVLLYCPSEKTDAGKVEKYLNDVFRSHKLDPHAKVIKDEKAFVRRISSLKPFDEMEDDGSVEYCVKLLKNLSM